MAESCEHKCACGERMQTKHGWSFWLWFSLFVFDAILMAIFGTPPRLDRRLDALEARLPAQEAGP